MKDQVSIVTQYLQIETSYAMIISGPYGVGKTHFFRNTLSPAIEKVPTAKDASKNFIPIHISLFGLASLEEIQTAIFTELLPILKNKNMKLALGLGKLVLRGIAQFKSLGNIDDYIDDIKKGTHNLLNYDRLAICFDDVDRKSDSLKIEELLGFINSLVENEGAKILIIANESELLDDEKYQKKLREKVIGVAIQYHPSAEVIYDEIIQERYSVSSKRYYEFLISNKDLIITTIKKQGSNFRNLIFFLEHFKLVFHCLENAYSVDANFSVQKEQKSNAVLKFSLAASIEYKMGRLNSMTLPEIENANPYGIDIKIFMNEVKGTPEEEIAPTYGETFASTYFAQNPYYFFPSISEFIMGQNAFDILKLKDELEKYFETEDGKIPRNEKVLNLLGFQNCFKLTDLEYKNLTNEMLGCVDQGMYKLKDYGMIFYFSVRFKNLLNFDISALVERFKKGIKKGINKYKPSIEVNFDFRIGYAEEPEFKPQLEEIVKFCRDVNENVQAIKSRNKNTDLFKLFIENYNEFIKEVEDQDSDFHTIPFWVQFPFIKVQRKIGTLTNDEIIDLGHYFKHRYTRYFSAKLTAELAIIQKLHEVIDKPKWRLKKNLRNACLNYLSECLKGSVVVLKEYAELT